MSSKVVSSFSGMLGERKLKISQVARETGISRTTLTNLYYNKGEAISFEVLGKLCKYFKCDVGEIIACQKDCSKNGEA